MLLRRSCECATLPMRAKLRPHCRFYRFVFKTKRSELISANAADCHFHCLNCANCQLMFRSHFSHIDVTSMHLSYAKVLKPKPPDSALNSQGGFQSFSLKSRHRKHTYAANVCEPHNRRIEIQRDSKKQPSDYDAVSG